MTTIKRVKVKNVQCGQCRYYTSWIGMWIRHILPATGWCRARKCWCKKAAHGCEAHKETRIALVKQSLRRWFWFVGILLFVGCSAISIQQTQDKKDKIPSEPTASAALQETVQREAQATSDLANVICGAGTTARSRDAKAMVKTADKVVTYLGKPSIPIDVTKDEELAQLHKAFEIELAQHRQDMTDWKAALADLRDSNAQLTEQVGTWKASFANLKFWFWCCVIVIVGLCVAFPALIPIFVKWGKRGVEAGASILHQQTTEIVHQIQEMRKHPKMPAKAKSLINDILSKQSPETRVLVAKIKNGLNSK